jgi:hypothetical protein
VITLLPYCEHDGLTTKAGQEGLNIRLLPYIVFLGNLQNPRVVAIVLRYSSIRHTSIRQRTILNMVNDVLYRSIAGSN